MFLMISLKNYGADIYPLQTGEKGAVRLDFQHELSKLGSLKHVLNAGLSKGHTVCDIGCGSGAMTVEFAKIVGLKGRVYAVDISQDQLNIAKKKCQDQGLDNVIFIQSDMKSDLNIEKVDFVYSRFFLMHVDDPFFVVLKMKNLLKNGGVILAQESVSENCDQEQVQGHVETVHKLFQNRGLEYDIENQMTDLYEKAGFSNIQEYFETDTVPLEKMKKLEKMNLQELCDKAIQENLATQQDCALWQSGIDEVTQDNVKPCFLRAKHLYITARKV